MSQSLLNFALWCLKGVHDDTRIAYSKNHAVLRHTSPFVFYQKFSTIVPISIFGLQHSLPKDRRVFLQRRGWRTGLLGWTIGALLGGTWGKEVEITPVDSANSLETVAGEVLSSSVKDSISKEIQATSTGDLKLLETAICHIPASSGDGYFRIRVTTANATQTIASTPAFRIISSSLNTASPRGATIFQLPIEFFAATSSKTAQIGAWGFFYACFPFLKLASWLPGGVSQATINTFWRWAGGQQRLDEARENYRVDERLAQAGELRDRADKAVPWGAIGVRRAFDVEADSELGRQGVSVRY